MKFDICILQSSAAINKAFNTLYEAIECITIVKTTAQLVKLKLSILVKNPNKNATITKYILETIKDNDQYSNNDIENNNLLNQTILVLVNPMSGKKQGQQVFDKVNRLLRSLAIKFDVVFTKSQRHIQEIHFKQYSKILFISGDGLIFDYLQLAVVNNHLDIPISIIKAGTGNALSSSIDTNNFEVSILTALYGKTSLIDITKYTLLEKDYYSILGFFWGIL